MNLLKSLTNLFHKEVPTVEVAKEEIALEPVSKENSTELEKILKSPVGYVGRGPRKLDDGQQLAIVKFIAQGLVPSQIVQRMKDEFDVEISINGCYHYENSPKWKTKIKELKVYYRDHLEEIPGSHKAVRLSRMEHVFEKAYQKNDLKTVVTVNEQMRKEFEKDSGDINIFHSNPVYQQFNSLTNEQLLERQREATLKLKLRRDEANGPDRPSEEDSGQ